MNKKLSVKVCRSLNIMLPVALLLAFSLREASGKSPVHLLFHAGAGQRSSLDEIAGIFQVRNTEE